MISTIWGLRVIRAPGPIITCILLTVLHIFLMLLVGRFCLKIKAFHLWWLFPLFSWLKCLIKQRHCEEKWDVGHHWGFFEGRVALASGGGARAPARGFAPSRALKHNYWQKRVRVRKQKPDVILHENGRSNTIPISKSLRTVFCYPTKSENGEEKKNDERYGLDISVTDHYLKGSKRRKRRFEIGMFAVSPVGMHLNPSPISLQKKTPGFCQPCGIFC